MYQCLVLVIVSSMVYYVHSQTDILIFARRTELRWANLSVPGDRGTWIPVHNLTNVIAVDFDENEGFVYWSDTNLKTLNRARLDGTGQTTLVSTDIEIPDGLTVDSKNRLLYWTDTGLNVIKRAELDGSQVTTVISDDLDEPRAIVLNKQATDMYWTDWGAVPKIEKSKVDGQARIVLINTSLIWPNGLTVDEEQGFIYWVDAGTDLLEKADIDGSNRNTLVTIVNGHPFGLYMHGADLYWSDWAFRAILKYTPNPESATIVHSYIPDDLFGIKAFTTPDGKDVLYVSGATELREISLNTFNDLGRKINVANISRAIALDYDPVEDYLYWSDINTPSINRVHSDGTGKDAITTTVSQVEGLAVCQVTRQIFWTDTGTNTIEVSNLDGTNRRLVITVDLEEPRGIALDVANRMVYWTEWGLQARIEKATYEGAGRTVLVNNSLYQPNDIVLDTPNNKMYWGDNTEQKIEVANLDGTNREVVIEATGAFGLTLLGDYLYWTDKITKTIRKVNKNNKEDTAILVSADPNNYFMGLAIGSKYTPPVPTPSPTPVPTPSPTPAPTPSPTPAPTLCRPCGGCKHVPNKATKITQVSACGTPKKCVKGTDKVTEVVVIQRKGRKTKRITRPTHCCYNFRKRKGTKRLRKARPCIYANGWA